MKKITLLIVVLSLTNLTLLQSCKSIKNNAQTNFEKNILLSAIQGKSSKPETLFLNDKEFTNFSTEVIGSHKDFWKIENLKNKNESQIIKVSFKPKYGFIGITKDTLVIKIKNKNKLIYALKGLSTKALEGKNEPPLYDIINVLDFNINLGWTTLSNTIHPKLQGDEIPQTLFVKAGNKNVEMLPVARYSPAFSLPFGYYIEKNDSVQKFEVGVLASSKTYPEHQTLSPKIIKGKTSFNPKKETFGFYTTSPSHTAYSQDKWNKFYHKTKAAHAVRIYEIKDKNGKRKENEYLVCFEEAKNGDYQDYVFILKNVKVAVN